VHAKLKDHHDCGWNERCNKGILLDEEECQKKKNKRAGLNGNYT
jgi:hypothetical protein